ncbi:hypothetical protein [Sphingosinithalassobacter sp. CS137]|uniref:hypothetical protein n=1 Tax=Sphingosinithalassobacter sp. CS137 TaxID=2762748 RepID=UPI00165DD09D|nr:hypothetical protein [Sphingosinithalassobacter sp. CS137]
MTGRQSCAAALGLAAAASLMTVPAHGQEAGAAPPGSAAVAAFHGALPARVAGVPRADGGYEPAMAVYAGAEPLDPVIAVAFADIEAPKTLRDLAALGRAEPLRVGLIETLFEGRFAIPGRAGARTFFGDYLTHSGIRQVWIAEQDGVRTTVSATIHRAEDRGRVFDGIRQALLGGAEMAAPLAAAETN